MEIKDIRNIHIKIRNKYSPEELRPEILTNIVEILFEYLSENNQADRLNPEDAWIKSIIIDELFDDNGNLKSVCDSQNCDNK